jgi:hypothetical protein
MVHVAPGKLDRCKAHRDVRGAEIKARLLKSCSVQVLQQSVGVEAMEFERTAGLTAGTAFLGAFSPGYP